MLYGEILPICIVDSKPRKTMAKNYIKPPHIYTRVFYVTSILFTPLWSVFPIPAPCHAITPIVFF